MKGDGDGDLTIDAGNGTVTFTGAVTIAKDDLTIADSAIGVVTAGIGGSTGSVDFTTTTRTDVDGTIALTGAGTVTLDAAAIRTANITTQAGAIDFSGRRIGRPTRTMRRCRLRAMWATPALARTSREHHNAGHL